MKVGRAVLLLLAAAQLTDGRPWTQLCCGAGKANFSQFFTQPEAWSTLRSELDSIKFFVGDVKKLEGIVPGGIKAVGSMFAQANLTVDIEAGGLRGFDCNGSDYAERTLQEIRPLVEQLTGTLRITFDGPFAHGLHQDSKTCNLTLVEAAKEVKANCKRTKELIHANHPQVTNVIFTWNEPIPWYSVGQFPAFENGTHNDFGNLLDLIDLVVRVGVPFSAFHADSPLGYNTAPGSDGYGKLDALMKHVRSRGLRFGKYFNDQAGGQSSDLAFEAGSIADARLFANRSGAPDDVIAESWYPYPHQALPERTRGTMGNTALSVIQMFA
jgi:hypothetical protein